MIQPSDSDMKKASEIIRQMANAVEAGEMWLPASYSASYADPMNVGALLRRVSNFLWGMDKLMPQIEHDWQRQLREASEGGEG